MSELGHIIDVHTHILPGLDDGPATLADAVRMCEAYESHGVRTIVATPHMMSGRWNVTADDVRRQARALRAACRERGMHLNVLTGAEVSLRPDLADLVARGEALTVDEARRYLVVELPSQAVPPFFRVVEELAAHGVTPVISHPERSPRLLRAPGMLAELVAMGCLVQVTSGSLLGRFGSKARRAAERLIAGGMAHLVASDAHEPCGYRGPDLWDCYAALQAEFGIAECRRLLFENPLAIVRGEAVTAIPGAVAPPVSRVAAPTLNRTGLPLD